MGSYEDTLTAEAGTWVIDDPKVQTDKLRRERIRHYRLVHDLLLDKLGTHDMDLLEVGGGPLPVSDLIRFRSRVVVDPLSKEYRRVAPCPHHVAMKIEELELRSQFDLAISTNALDHVENPQVAVEKIRDALRPGGFFAVMCAENNAITHPHPCHVHNLTAELIHQWLDLDFETVRELTFRDHGYRYGWVEFEGRRGQPAFALLLRKCTGYS